MDFLSTREKPKKAKTPEEPGLYKKDFHIN